ncbi:MAG: hypothetical protein FJ320_06705 [SAR202 cluster bacterium]|nr:hypothetical protein [SAR202 cluster bacterium]
MVRTPHRHDRDVDHEHDDLTHDHPQTRRTATRYDDRPVVDRHVGEQEVESHRSVSWMPWSPAQMIALTGGVAFMVLGALAVIRGGFDDIQAHTSVWTFHHTTLMGLITIGFGGLLALGGMAPNLSRAMMVFLGVVALAFGLIVVIEPAAEFHEWLGVHDRNGWLYMIIGGSMLLLGLIAPVLFGSQDVHSRRSATRY